MSHIRPALSNGECVMTMNPRKTRHSHLRVAFKASSMFGKQGVCFMSLPKSTRGCFCVKDSSLLLPDPILASAHPSSVDHLELADSSLESRSSAASYTWVSAEASGAEHVSLHCLALSLFTSPPQKLYRCIQIFSREEFILSHSRQIKIEQHKSSGHATQGISYWLLSP